MTLAKRKREKLGKILVNTDDRVSSSSNTHREIPAKRLHGSSHYPRSIIFRGRGSTRRSRYSSDSDCSPRASRLILAAGQDARLGRVLSFPGIRVASIPSGSCSIIYRFLNDDRNRLCRKMRRFGIFILNEPWNSLVSWESRSLDSQSKIGWDRQLFKFRSIDEADPRVYERVFERHDTICRENKESWKLRLEEFSRFDYADRLRKIDGKRNFQMEYFSCDYRIRFLYKCFGREIVTSSLVIISL